MEIVAMPRCGRRAAANCCRLWTTASRRQAPAYTGA